MSKLFPSLEQQHALQAAHDHFNRCLFDMELGRVYFAFQNKGQHILGSYRNSSDKNRETDEVVGRITLNSIYLLGRDKKDTFGTLVHEMCHQYICENDKKLREGHGPRWRELMTDVGLEPVKIQGGYTHKIVAGGKFEVAYLTLPETAQALTWGEFQRSHKASGRKTIYRCPSCGQKAYGARDLDLLCGRCTTNLKRLVKFEAQG